MTMQDFAGRDPLVVVGVDPGTKATGYGVVGRSGGRLVRVDHGTFRPSRDDDVAGRLWFLFDRLRALMRHHAPDLVALEQVFFAKNPQTTLRIGEARTVVILAAAEVKVPVIQYPTKTAKRSVTGTGSADKALVQRMVASELGMEELPEPFDASDALALALCALRDPKLDPRFA